MNTRRSGCPPRIIATLETVPRNRRQFANPADLTIQESDISLIVEVRRTCVGRCGAAEWRPRRGRFSAGCMFDELVRPAGRSRCKRPVASHPRQRLARSQGRVRKAKGRRSNIRRKPGCRKGDEQSLRQVDEGEVGFLPTWDPEDRSQAGVGFRSGTGVLFQGSRGSLLFRFETLTRNRTGMEEYR